MQRRLERERDELPHWTVYDDGSARWYAYVYILDRFGLGFGLGLTGLDWTRLDWDDFRESVLWLVIPWFSFLLVSHRAIF